MFIISAVIFIIPTELLSAKQVIEIRKIMGFFSKTALLRRTVHKIAWPSKQFQEQDENSPFKLILQFQSINFIA